MGMDEILEDLRRKAASNPADAKISAAYEAMLLRAGQRDQVKERFRFELLCDKRWEDLRRGRFQFQPGQRFCEDCQKPVHRVSTFRQLRRRAVEGSCVAVSSKNLEDRLDDLVEEAAREGTAAKPPCFVLEKEPGEDGEFPWGGHFWRGRVRIGRVALPEGGASFVENFLKSLLGLG